MIEPAMSFSKRPIRDVVGYLKERETKNLSTISLNLVDVYASTSFETETPESLAVLFFRESTTECERISSGVIETPDYVCDFIVRSAAERYVGKELGQAPLSV